LGAVCPSAVVLGRSIVVIVILGGHLPCFFDELGFSGQDAKHTVYKITLAVEISPTLMLLFVEIIAQIVKLKLRYLLEKLKLADFGNGRLVLLSKVSVEHPLVIAFAKND
jgi:hypothetical protein